MYHPTTRLLTVLELLQAHGRLSGPELARRLDVDVRTLRRYIVRLEELGIPIMAERGRHGVYALVAGYKLPPMMFNDDEALALSLGLLAAGTLGLASATPAVESAQAKIERVLPTALKTRVHALAETVRLQLRPGSPRHDGQTLLTLSSAAHAGQRVAFHYQAGSGQQTDREVDPYGLIYRDGLWYLVGHCHLRQALRNFRLDRISQVTARSQVFNLPADFDPVGFLDQQLASLPRSERVEVRLHTNLDTARQAFRPDIGLFLAQADSVLLQARTDHLDWFARQLACLPFDFDILHPSSLQQALHNHAQKLLRHQPHQQGQTATDQAAASPAQPADGT
ncbi:helix-turn-helix transcriptional regulator [Chitinimonas sp. JJ19]|uniref:helix-turn-helix transcriptional regulator n=1 Tax=Chitinimonas sp. JJ19 TaxID=3109352 RepID=UPI001A4396A7|nr:YafY family transcriptional regulator [Chitinimonas sp.]